MTARLLKQIQRAKSAEVSDKTLQYQRYLFFGSPAYGFTLASLRRPVASYIYLLSP